MRLFWTPKHTRQLNEWVDEADSPAQAFEKEGRLQRPFTERTLQIRENPTGNVVPRWRHSVT
jgi:hypothetical protein